VPGSFLPVPVPAHDLRARGHRGHRHISDHPAQDSRTLTQFWKSFLRKGVVATASGMLSGTPWYRLFLVAR